MRIIIGTIALTLTLLATPAHATLQAFPPCPTEDSAGPCYWNPQTEGNGLGASFWVLTDGTVVYR